MTDHITAPAVGDMTEEQQQAQAYALRLARLAAEVLTGDPDNGRLGHWLATPREGDTGLAYDTGTTGWWITAHASTVGCVPRADIQVFDLAHNAGKLEGTFRAKVIVGAHPFASEAYLSSALSDYSIRRIIRGMHVLFWENRNRTDEDLTDHDSTEYIRQCDPEQDKSSVQEALSQPETPSGGTGEGKPSLTSETALRRDTIATDLAATILDHVSGVLDDEELDERLETISGLITSWGSCPTSVAEAMEWMIWHHDRRNLTDEEIKNRLVHLRTLVRTENAGEVK